MENRITFKIKIEYYLKLLTPETMKLLVSTKSKITKDENGENLPYLEVTEIVLVHCNFVNNHYQQNSRVWYTFVPNISFCQLLDILPQKIIFLEFFDLKFSYISLIFIIKVKNINNDILFSSTQRSIIFKRLWTLILCKKIKIKIKG